MYYFVYCKSFNVLLCFCSPSVTGAKSVAKLRQIFELTKFFIKFSQKIYHLSFCRDFIRPLCNFSEALPKSECKVTTFLYSDQIFLQVFSHFLIISLLIRGLWENQESGRTGKTGNDEKTGNDGNDLKY